MDLANADTWGAAIYFWIIPIVLGDAIFPPIPSEMVVITGGALSAEGRANFLLVGVLSALASWIGDVVVFQLFKRRLSHVLDRWRWGRKFHSGIHAAIAKAGPFHHVRRHHRCPVHSRWPARDVGRGGHCRRHHPRRSVSARRWAPSSGPPIS